MQHKRVVKSLAPSTPARSPDLRTGEFVPVGQQRVGHHIAGKMDLLVLHTAFPEVFSILPFQYGPCSDSLITDLLRHVR